MQTEILQICFCQNSDWSELFRFAPKIAVRYELCIGLNKGHKTTKLGNVRYTGDKKAQGLRGYRLKNIQRFQRELVSGVCGHYEKKAFLKLRLRTHILVRRKSEELSNILTQMRKTGHAN
uniref:Large ribosomal subunit protein eL36 n=1 Tax=Megaselia scalaris TaxID=36166 RepID=T1H589_MEGSC